MMKRYFILEGSSAEQMYAMRYHKMDNLDAVVHLLSVTILTFFESEAKAESVYLYL